MRSIHNDEARGYNRERRQGMDLEPLHDPLKNEAILGLPAKVEDFAKLSGGLHLHFLELPELMHEQMKK